MVSSTSPKLSMQSAELSALLQAIAFAADKHRHQRRKDAAATPYINHPIGLMNILCNEAGVTDCVVLMGAVLHDTVEDTDAELADLERQFGPAVADVVRQVTDDKSLPQEVRKQEQVAHAAVATPAAKLVKLADKIHNLRDLVKSPPENWSMERRREYCHWGKQVVDQMRGTHAGLEELFDAIYAEAITLYNESSTVL